MRNPQHLTILLHGQHIADLERTRQTLRLTYHPNTPGTEATPLSLSLPPERSPFTGRAVETYLWGLLPESSEARRAISQTHGADPYDPVSLLAAIGKDCAGAVQFCPPDELEATIKRDGHLEEASDSDIEARLADMRLQRDPSWAMPGEHWSLGGMQAKFTIRYESGRWHYATGAVASTHIVKPGVHAMIAQALMEHISMAAARHMDLDVAHTDYVDFKSERAIVIRRFDRIRDGSGTVSRVHQEDLCQALGVSEKYQEHGGPSPAQLVTMLRDAAATPAQARRNTDAFIDGLIYNTVIGAPDAHARNYAVFLDGDNVGLAPLYDVASGLPYSQTPTRGHVLSMSVGGTFELSKVDGDAWRRFAADLQVDEQLVLNRVAELAEQAPRAFEEALDAVEDWDDSVTSVRERLMPALNRHVATVAI